MKKGLYRTFISFVFAIDVHRLRTGFIDMSCHKTHLRQEHTLNVLRQHRYMEVISTNYNGHQLSWCAGLSSDMVDEFVLEKFRHKIQKHFEWLYKCSQCTVYQCLASNSNDAKVRGSMVLGWNVFANIQIWLDEGERGNGKDNDLV